MNNILKEKELKIIDNNNGYYHLIDENGYHLSLTLDTLKNREKHRIIDKHNPYSIENIKRWLVLKKKTCKLISTNYKDNNTKLEWKCKCGNSFFASISKVMYRNKEFCNECSLKLKTENIRKTSELIKSIKEKGYKILTKGSIKNCDDKIVVIDKFGYKYELIGRSYLKYKPIPIIKTNPYVIENIKNYLKKNEVPLQLLSNKYCRNNKKLTFKCHCGNTFDSSWVDVIYNNRIFCPKCSCHISKGEQKIEKYLKQNGIKYKRQYSFEDCYFNIKGKLRFDFIIYVNNKIKVVEFQGIQHYKPIDYFGGKKGFSYQKKRDAIKRNYCKKNKIPLLEIPYYDLKEEVYIESLKNFTNL